MWSGSGAFKDDDLAGDTFKITVNYGDGTVPVTMTLATTSFPLQHRYSTVLVPRSYTITVTITDGEGASGSATTVVSVIL
jgi:hypothetical protein